MNPEQTNKIKKSENLLKKIKLFLNEITNFKNSPKISETIQNQIKKIENSNNLEILHHSKYSYYVKNNELNNYNYYIFDLNLNKLNKFKSTENSNNLENLEFEFQAFVVNQICNKTDEDEEIKFSEALKFKKSELLEFPLFFSNVLDPSNNTNLAENICKLLLIQRSPNLNLNLRASMELLTKLAAEEQSTTPKRPLTVQNTKRKKIQYSINLADENSTVNNEGTTPFDAISNVSVSPPDHNNGSTTAAAKSMINLAYLSPANNNLSCDTQTIPNTESESSSSSIRLLKLFSATLLPANFLTYIGQSFEEMTSRCCTQLLFYKEYEEILNSTDANANANANTNTKSLLFKTREEAELFVSLHQKLYNKRSFWSQLVLEMNLCCNNNNNNGGGGGSYYYSSVSLQSLWKNVRKIVRTRQMDERVVVIREKEDVRLRSNGIQFIGQSFEDIFYSCLCSEIVVDNRTSCLSPSLLIGNIVGDGEEEEEEEEEEPMARESSYKSQVEFVEKKSVISSLPDPSSSPLICDIARKDDRSVVASICMVEETKISNEEGRRVSPTSVVDNPKRAASLAMNESIYAILLAHIHDKEYGAFRENEMDLLVHLHKKFYCVDDLWKVISKELLKSGFIRDHQMLKSYWDKAKKRQVGFETIYKQLKLMPTISGCFYSQQDVALFIKYHKIHSEHDERWSILSCKFENKGHKYSAESLKKLWLSAKDAALKKDKKRRNISSIKERIAKRKSRKVDSTLDIVNEESVARKPTTFPLTNDLSGTIASTRILSEKRDPSTLPPKNQGKEEVPQLVETDKVDEKGGKKESMGMITTSRKRSEKNGELSNETVGYTYGDQIIGEEINNNNCGINELVGYIVEDENRSSVEDVKNIIDFSVVNDGVKKIYDVLIERAGNSRSRMSLEATKAFNRHHMVLGNKWVQISKLMAEEGFHFTCSWLKDYYKRVRISLEKSHKCPKNEATKLKETVLKFNDSVKSIPKNCAKSMNEGNSVRSLRRSSRKSLSSEYYGHYIRCHNAHQNEGGECANCDRLVKSTQSQPDLKFDVKKSIGGVNELASGPPTKFHLIEEIKDSPMKERKPVTSRKSRQVRPQGQEGRIVKIYPIDIRHLKLPNNSLKRGVEQLEGQFQRHLEKRNDFRDRIHQKCPNKDDTDDEYEEEKKLQKKHMKKARQLAASEKHERIVASPEQMVREKLHAEKMADKEYSLFISTSLKDFPSLENNHRKDKCTARFCKICCSDDDEDCPNDMAVLLPKVRKIEENDDYDDDDECPNYLSRNTQRLWEAKRKQEKEMSTVREAIWCWSFIDVYNKGLIDDN